LNSLSLVKGHIWREAIHFLPQFTRSCKKSYSDEQSELAQRDDVLRHLEGDSSSIAGKTILSDSTWLNGAIVKDHDSLTVLEAPELSFCPKRSQLQNMKPVTSSRESGVICSASVNEFVEEIFGFPPLHVMKIVLYSCHVYSRGGGESIADHQTPPIEETTPSPNPWEYKSFVNEIENLLDV
jgi:hypothetical protein